MTSGSTAVFSYIYIVLRAEKLLLKSTGRRLESNKRWLSRTLLTYKFHVAFQLPDIHISGRTSICPIDDFVTKEIYSLIGLWIIQLEGCECRWQMKVTRSKPMLFRYDMQKKCKSKFSVLNIDGGKINNCTGKTWQLLMQKVIQAWQEATNLTGGFRPTRREKQTNPGSTSWPPFSS